MTAITFDTLRFVEKLEIAGMPRQQAKANAEALAEVLEKGTGELATQGDIRELENKMKIALTETKIDIMKWVIGLALAQMGLLVSILMRLPHN